MQMLQWVCSRSGMRQLWLGHSQACGLPGSSNRGLAHALCSMGACRGSVHRPQRRKAR